MICKKCWENKAVEGGNRCKECLKALSKLCTALVSPNTQGEQKG